MNSDIAHQVATRPADRAKFVTPPEGSRYCWSCSTYKPGDQVPFGARCWDCRHLADQRAAAQEAVALISRGRPANALYVLALAVDRQAAAEGIELPPHQQVARHAARRILEHAFHTAHRVRATLRFASYLGTGR